MNIINQLSPKFPLIILPNIYSRYLWHHIPWLHFLHGGETMFITCRLVCIPALKSGNCEKMYGCFLKGLHSQRFNLVHLNIDSWALPWKRLNLIVLFTRVGLTCTILHYDVPAIESDVWYSVSVSWCEPANVKVSVSPMFVLSHLQRSGQIRGVGEMELRSRRLCHIPHVAFIIESMHACLHRERPESTALSVARAFGERGFFFNFNIQAWNLEAATDLMKTNSVRLLVHLFLHY